MWNEWLFTFPTVYDYDNRSLSNSFPANKNYNNEIKAEQLFNQHNRLHCSFFSTAKAHGNLTNLTNITNITNTKKTSFYIFMRSLLLNCMLKKYKIVCCYHALKTL